MLHNLGHNLIKLFQHLIVGKTQHGVAQSLQIALPLMILLGLICVYVAIYFHDQLMGKAAEIHDVLVDRLLTAKT